MEYRDWWSYHSVDGLINQGMVPRKRLLAATRRFSGSATKSSAPRDFNLEVRVEVYVR